MSIPQWSWVYSAASKIVGLGSSDLADILRYARVGVRISAGIVAHIGTRLGGFGELFDAARTSCTVSRDGCTSN